MIQYSFYIQGKGENSGSAKPPSEKVTTPKVKYRIRH